MLTTPCTDELEELLLLLLLLLLVLLLPLPLFLDSSAPSESETSASPLSLPAQVPSPSTSQASLGPAIPAGGPTPVAWSNKSALGKPNSNPPVFGSPDFVIDNSDLMVLVTADLRGLALPFFRLAFGFRHALPALCIQGVHHLEDGLILQRHGWPGLEC